MEINATAHLNYDDRRGSIFDDESLNLIITFKEPGHFFRTKLEKRLVIKGYESNELEFINKVKNYISDLDLVRSRAKMIIENYFNKLNEEENINKSIKSIKKRVKGIGKIEVKVEIKQ